MEKKKGKKMVMQRVMGGEEDEVERETKQELNIHEAQHIIKIATHTATYKKKCTREKKR